MQREIKFRIYDPFGYDSKMIYSEGISFPRVDPAGVIRELNEEAISFLGMFMNWGGRLKHMQYTGLKDRNGVEIYEGDIIKFAYDDYLTIVEPMDTGRYSAFWSFADFRDPADEELGAQVIGNIYENRELLENKS